LGADALDATNLAPLAALLALLPVVVNATFYLELALGRSLAWVDAWLTARWETIVYACSAGLALAWLRLAHAGLGPVETFVAGAAAGPRRRPGPGATRGGGARPALSRRPAGGAVERAPLRSPDVPRDRRRGAGAARPAARAHARDRGVGTAGGRRLRANDHVHRDPHRNDAADPCVEPGGGRGGPARQPRRQAGGESRERRG